MHELGRDYQPPFDNVKRCLHAFSGRNAAFGVCGDAPRQCGLDTLRDGFHEPGDGAFALVTSENG